MRLFNNHIIFFCLILFGGSCSIISNNEPIETGLGIDYTLKIDFEPTWSPDGEWIAYVHQPADSSDPDTAGIYFIRPDGTDKKLWLSGPSYYTPDWSPDGNWIVYEKGGELFKRTVEGDSVIQLTSKGSNFFPSWSPDGQWIAFDSNRLESSPAYFIWKMKENGSDKKIIGYSPTGEGSTRSPNWASDNQIYHVRYLKDVFGTQIFRMDESGSYEERLTENEFRDQHPDYSLASGKITYTSVRIEYGDRFPDIWVMDKDGSNPVKLTDELQIVGDYSRWSPDGNHIVFTNIAPNNGRLWIMDKDGNNKKQITF